MHDLYVIYVWHSACQEKMRMEDLAKGRICTSVRPLPRSCSVIYRPFWYAVLFYLSKRCALNTMMLHFQVKFEDKVHLTNCYRYLNDQEEFLIPNSFSFQSDHLVHHDLVLASEVHYQVVELISSEGVGYHLEKTQSLHHLLIETNSNAPPKPCTGQMALHTSQCCHYIAALLATSWVADF